jgi:hypothetical protein
MPVQKNFEFEFNYDNVAQVCGHVGPHTFLFSFLSLARKLWQSLHRLLFVLLSSLLFPVSALD